MRGKRPRRMFFHSSLRIIPAHAGQTRFCGLKTSVTTDHPRACGANAAYFCTVADASGSSPRMRGKHRPHAGHHEPFRIIPAHAGQTGNRSGVSGGATDHPRACGANGENPGDDVDYAGSSPRMRGKQWHRHTETAWLRIIPAHAGQTNARTSCRYCSTDHPRACGANNVLFIIFVGHGGSSPRMRGKRSNRLKPRTGTRIIPAHAGQTSAIDSAVILFADHPRACGANDVFRML